MVEKENPDREIRNGEAGNRRNGDYGVGETMTPPNVVSMSRGSAPKK